MPARNHLQAVLKVISLLVSNVTYSKGGDLPRQADYYSMDRTPRLSQKFLAELLGTSFLVWVGPGSITTTLFLAGGKLPFSMAELGMIALAFAFAIAAMVYTIGHISGCHINPAVTLAFAITKRIPWNEAVVYWAGQLIGAFLGAAFIGVCYGFTTAATIGYGATNFSDVNTGYVVATAAEIIGTFFLLLVIMGTAVDGRAPAGWAGLIISLAVAADIFAFGPVTNVALNPFRALAPAVLQVLFGGTYNLAHLIVYFVGPIVGAILGVLVYDFMTRAHVAGSAELGGVSESAVESR
jgi:glycerol uptake facilitator protein